MKTSIKLMTFLLISMLLCASVSSLGVTPARNPVAFEPNKEISGKFKIINSENINRELVIQTGGELGGLITLDERRVQLVSGEEERVVTYTVKLPNELNPGNHIGEISISEPQPEITDENTIVGATLSVVTQVLVTVPYPGKYIEAIINIKSAGAGEDVKFIIPILNKGEFNIEDAHANIDIYTELNEKIDSFNTNSISIESDKRGELIHVWNANVPVGNYKAVVTVIYDGESTSLEDTFKVGSELLELQEISVNNFELGDIAKMELLVENKWSKVIEKVHTQVQVFNDAGNILADFNSPDASIEPLSKKVLTSFWDTAGVNEGTYNTKVTLHYDDGNPIDTDLQLAVSQNNIEVIGLGYVLSESGDPGFNASDNLVTILIIIIGILVLVNLLWFFMLRRSLKKKK